MNQDLYQLLAARAHGRCECGCQRRVPPGEADHFFGRAKAEEVEFNVWILTPDCHRAKTDNKPSADFWLLKFIEHCGRYRIYGNGYATAAIAAEKKREWLSAKKAASA